MAYWISALSFALNSDTWEGVTSPKSVKDIFILGRDLPRSVASIDLCSWMSDSATDSEVVN